MQKLLLVVTLNDYCGEDSAFTLPEDQCDQLADGYENEARDIDTKGPFAVFDLDNPNNGLAAALKELGWTPPLRAPSGYRVRWEIDEEASSPEEAAKRARLRQYPGTSAVRFDVYDGDGRLTEVDLQDEKSEFSTDPLMELVQREYSDIIIMANTNGLNPKKAPDRRVALREVCTEILRRLGSTT